MLLKHRLKTQNVVKIPGTCDLRGNAIRGDQNPFDGVFFRCLEKIDLIFDVFDDAHANRIGVVLAFDSR